MCPRRHEAARSDFEEGGKLPEESKVTIEKRETTICKSFRVTPSEAKRIEEVAAQNGVSESVLVRNGLKTIGVLERI